MIDHQVMEGFVPKDDIEDLIRRCQKEKDYYLDLGSMAQVECYTEFIDMLSSLTLSILDDYDDEG